MPKNEVAITIENYQIVGSDTLRIDLSFVGTVQQDGKELTLNHERETVYVRKKKWPEFVLDRLADIPIQHDPRQVARI